MKLLTRRAAEKFADVLYMPIVLGDGPSTGKVTMRVSIPDGPRIPFELEIVDEYGDNHVAGADAFVLLRGPGDFALFLGRAMLADERKEDSKPSEHLILAILDARVVREKASKLAGALTAYNLTTVASVLDEYASAVKATFVRSSTGSTWR